MIDDAALQEPTRLNIPVIGALLSGCSRAFRTVSTGFP
jgi:hypothetical protein